MPEEIEVIKVQYNSLSKDVAEIKKDVKQLLTRSTVQDEFKKAVTHQIWAPDGGSKIERALRISESTAAAQSAAATRIWAIAVTLLGVIFTAAIGLYIRVEQAEVTHVIRSSGESRINSDVDASGRPYTANNGTSVPANRRNAE